MTSDFASIPPDDARSWDVEGADGARLRLYRLNAGRTDAPVLLLGHCNGFSAGCYLPLLRALASRHDVFAFDHRGHGGSGPCEATAGEALADAVALDVERVVQAVARLRPDARIHYVGHSLSGAAALRHMTRFAERFEALPLAQTILIEPPVFPDADHPLFEVCTRSTIALVARTLRRRRDWESPAAYAAALRGRGPFAAFAEGMLDQVALATLRPSARDFTLACRPEMEAAIFSTWGRPILFPALSRISTATRMTLVGGDPDMPENDWVTTMMASVAERVPALDYVVMKGRGHLWPFEAPTDAVSFLAARIAGNDPAKFPATKILHANEPPIA